MKTVSKIIYSAIALLTPVVVATSLDNKSYFKSYEEDRIQNVAARVENIENFWSEEPDYGAMTWQEAISYVKTPEDVKGYIARLRNPKDNGRHMFSFRMIHQGAPVDCTEAATAAAALLSDDGYQPVTLILADKGFFLRGAAHQVFLYRREGKFGSIGINYSDNKDPTYATIDELAKALSEEYAGWGFNPNSYAIINLAENGNFMSGERNMQKNPSYDHRIPK